MTEFQSRQMRIGQPVYGIKHKPLECFESDLDDDLLTKPIPDELHFLINAAAWIYTNAFSIGEPYASFTMQCGIASGRGYFDRAQDRPRPFKGKEAIIFIKKISEWNGALYQTMEQLVFVSKCLRRT